MFLGGDRRDRDSATAYSKTSLSSVQAQDVSIGLITVSMSRNSYAGGVRGDGVGHPGSSCGRVQQGEAGCVCEPEPERLVATHTHCSSPGNGRNIALNIKLEWSLTVAAVTLMFLQSSSCITLVLYSQSPREIVFPCNLLLLAQQCVCVCVLLVIAQLYLNIFK